MNEVLKIIREVKLEIENELKKPNFLEYEGNEYFIECKGFNVFITSDYSRFSFCDGDLPISEIYPENHFEVLAALTIIKKYT